MTPAPTPAATTPAQIQCHIVESQTLTVGQKSSLTCDMTALGDLTQKKINFIQIDPKLNYDIQFLGEPQVVNGALSQIFTSYKVGRHTLSTIQLKIGDQTFPVAPLDFEVKSVVNQTAGSKPTPFPEVDPSDVPVPAWWWAMWGLIVAVVLGFVIWKLIERRRKKKEAAALAAVVNLTPVEKFQLALRQLESKGLHLKGDYKTFAVDLTFLIKKTLGNELHFPAEDLTSEELLSTLERRHQTFYNSAGNTLATFLADLDRIKFAKVETNQEQCSGLLDKAGRIGNAIFGRLS